MADIASSIAAATLLGQAPLDPSGATGQALPFLLAGLVILAVVVWGLAGGLRRRRQGP